MVQLRSLLRFAALLGSAVILSTCAHSNTNPPSPGGGNAGFVGACGSVTASANRDAPIVCIDDTGSALTVSPDPIRVNQTHSTTHAPVVLQWHTKSGNDVQIEMEPGCVEPVKCTKGHCTTKAMPTSGSETRCKYSIEMSGHPKLDPDVIIIPCC
jgi:hypothetical protein